MNPEFPTYRKLSNSKAFYKINSPDEFEEIQLLGRKRLYYVHEAVQYFEKLKIKDMLALRDNYLASSADEWNENLNRRRQQRS